MRIFYPPSTKEVSLIKNSLKIINLKADNTVRGKDPSDKFLARVAVAEALSQPRFFLVGSQELFKSLMEQNMFSDGFEKYYSNNFIDEKKVPGDILAKGIRAFYIKPLCGYGGINIIHVEFNKDHPEFNFLTTYSNSQETYKQILALLAATPKDWENIWTKILYFAQMMQGSFFYDRCHSQEIPFCLIEETIPYTHWKQNDRAYETRHFMVPIYGKGEMISDWIPLYAYAKLGPDSTRAHIGAGGERLEINKSFNELVRDSIGNIPSHYSEYGEILNKKLKTTAENLTGVLEYNGPLAIDLVHTISADQSLPVTYFMEFHRCSTLFNSIFGSPPGMEILEHSWKKAIRRLFK